MRHLKALVALAGIVAFTSCGNDPQPPSVSEQPQSATFPTGAVAFFSVQANGQAPLSYQWSRDGIAITGATDSTYLTDPIISSDTGATFSVVIKNSVGSFTSATAMLTVSAASNTDVLTYHNDVSRSGLNASEAKLLPGNVTATHFRMLFMDITDGKIDAQPLVVSNLIIAGAAHNVVYVATEHDSVYAFDADTGVTLWTTTLLDGGNGEVPSDTLGCNFVSPEIGVTATPAIDRVGGIIYLVATTKDSAGGYHQRLHALSLTSGAETTGSPTEVPSAFAGQTQTFDASRYLERSALLLANGKLYTSWTSHCDVAPYSSWVITFDAATLQVSQVFNGELGDAVGAGSFWNSGSGPAADVDGNVYLLSANGTFDAALDSRGFPINQDYGNSFLKLAPPVQSTSVLTLTDYFTMYDSVTESAADKDLGSGGGMLLPDQTDANGTVRHLMVGAGKDNNVYVVDRDNMGKWQASGNSQIWQELSNAFPNAQYGVFGAPSYFDGKVYFAPVADGIHAFSFSSGLLSTTAVDSTTNTFTYPGAAFSISASGTKDGIVWAVENSSSQGILHAYDASNLATELYNSTLAGTRDNFGPGSKFTPPTIANGKVFVVTQVDLTNNPTGYQEGIAVFGAF